jgi:hypothetical protein
MARPAVHLIVSTGLATIQWIRTGRAAPTLAPLVSGFLVDADHTVEMIRYHGAGKQAQGRVILPFHGWEFIPVLILIEKLFRGQLAGGLVLGYAAHLLIDQLTNTTTHPLTYFISFRAKRGFPSHLFDHVDEKAIDWLNVPIWQLWKHF